MLGPRTSDYYPSAVATEARASTNVVAHARPPACFRGTRAFDDIASRCARSGVPLPAKVVACLRGLPMGDLNAPDWGAEAHTRLLTRAGTYAPAHRLINGHAGGLPARTHLPR